jgi:hypothetical protein
MRTAKHLRGSSRAAAGAVVRASRARVALLLAQTIAFSAYCCGTSPLGGQAAESQGRWKTGVAFRQQLDALVGVRWSSNPVRAALTNLARNQGVAIFLDRRADPDQKLEHTANNLPLRTLIDDVASQLQLGTCRVGAVVYVGPKETAAVLGTVAALKEDQTRQLPAAVRARASTAQPCVWPELSMPRELIEQCVSRVGLRLNGADQVPHDLWPAVDLPPLTFAQRLSLLLAGFGLTFEYADDGTAVRLVPLPREAVLERSYSPRGSADAVAARVVQRFPAARVTAAAGKLLVVGPIEVHEAVEDLVHGAPRKTPTGKPSAKGTVVYTLRIENKPLGGVVAAVAKRIEREVRFDPRVSPKLQELISFEVKQAELDELLRSMLTPVGLDYRLDDETLTIVPAQ